MIIPGYVKNLIFDLDGVLWDSSQIHDFAYKKIFEKYKFKPITYSTLAGKKTFDVISDIIFNETGKVDHDLAKQITIEKQLHSSTLLEQNPPLHKNLNTTLNQLKKKYSLCLATSSSKKNTDIFLEKSKTGNLFDFIITSEDVEFAKPHPEIYLNLMNRINFSTNQNIVIEDSLNGITAAKKANLKCIGVIGTHTKDCLLKAGAYSVIESLESLCH